MSAHRFTRARRRADHSDEHEGESRERWLVSYADLVTLLFALFVVLYAAADKERARLVSQAMAQEFGEGEKTCQGDDCGPDAGRGVLP
ncbi:MAG: flagellar motor protein MotB, partial [Pyrinomonadaceae bacterium]